MALPGSNRDVRLGIEIETAGEGDVKRLAEAVRALGQEGDPAAAEYNRLADQLDRLAQQSDALAGLRSLTTEVERLASVQGLAATSAQTATAAYRAQQAAVESLRADQILASAEVSQSQAALTRLSAELERQVIAGKAAGSSNKELAATTAEARLAVVNQTEALRQRRQTLTETNSALRAAEQAERQLQARFTETNAAASTSAAAFAEKNAALAASRAAADALGISVDNLATAETALVAAARAAATEASRLDQEARDSAEAMRLLGVAATAADREMEQLAGSLRGAETAAREYTQATERAAAAGADDVAAAQARVAAAERLIASERELTAAQRQLAVERDRSRASALAEAQALLTQTRALEASRTATAALVRDSIALGTALDGTGRSIGRVGTLTEEAFGRTGVRSLQAIENEIGQVDRAMSLLERRFRSGQISATDLARATTSAQTRLAALKREAETFPGATSTFQRINDSITGLLTKFGALGAAIATVGVAVRPVLDATVALEQMRRVLTTVTGSADTAQQQIQFLRQVAQDSGQQFDQLGASYAKFAASALQSGLTIEQTQEVFRSVAQAAGNLGLSSDQAKRALEALSQIASKGTVTMEELRQQLGDALPGVLPLLAKELGLTQAELNKVVESGQLLAGEAIPAIGRSLQALQAQNGRVEGLVASWNRFINVIKQAGVEVTQGPIGQAAGVILTAFAGAIRDVSVVAVSASEAIGLMGRVVGTTIAAFANGREGIRGLGAELDRLTLESGARIEQFKTTAYGAAEGTQTLGAEVAKLGSSFARLALDNQTAIDKAVLTAQSAEKNVQAKKAEADAVTTLSGLLGDETAAREGALVAAQALLTATQQQLTADQGVVEALTRTKDATIEKAKAEGLGADAIKTTVIALDAKIEKAQADADKTRSQVEAARAHAAAMGLAAEAALDNSRRIDELKRAVVAAGQALVDKQIAMARDKATSDDVKAAAIELAKAKGLLRDAIDDVSKALEREIAALRATAEVSRAGIELEIAKAKNARDAALAAGFETAARVESIRIRELELQLTRAGNGLKLQEAQATLNALDVMERELRLTGQLTTEKLAEIEARRKSAIAKTLEAAAGEEGAKSQRTQIDLLKQGGSALEDYERRLRGGTNATEGNTGATNENSGARDRNTSSIRQQAAAIGELSSVVERNNRLTAESAAADKARESNNAKAGAALGGDPFFDLQRRRNEGRLEAGDLADAEAVFSNFKDNLTRVQKSRPGTFSLEARFDAQAQYNQARLILDDVRRLAAQQGVTGSSTTQGGGATTVNINWGGKTARINTASPADSAALTQFLQQLGDDAQRSGG